MNLQVNFNFKNFRYICLMWIISPLFSNAMSLKATIDSLKENGFPMEKFEFINQIRETEEGFTDWLSALQYVYNARRWSEKEKPEIILLLFTLGLLQHNETTSENFSFSKDEFKNLSTEELLELQKRIGKPLPEFLQWRLPKIESPEHVSDTEASHISDTSDESSELDPSLLIPAKKKTKKGEKKTKNKERNLF